jgi:Ca-activated chloride channel family protein
MVDVGIAGDNTAIGEGIAQSVRTLKFGSAKEKIIILVSDGFSNAGSISIEDALKLSHKDNIKIYTIGLGKKSDFDYPLMQRIAHESKAESFAVNSTKELKEVYQKINSLESTPIRSEQYMNKKALFTYPLGVATMLFIWLLYRRKII